MFFFFNDPATTEIYTLPLHDALPICIGIEMKQPNVLTATTTVPTGVSSGDFANVDDFTGRVTAVSSGSIKLRSEEHTSELQSHLNLVCRLLLEKKKHAITSAIAHKRH